jgi:drug/metabolite transporter (DMT)-like permease
MSEKLKAVFAAIACVFFWGFSFVSSKIALGAFPPMTLGLFRFSMGVGFLFIIKRRLVPNEKLDKRDIPLLAFSGLAGDTFYFFCENNGLYLLPASEAAIITASIPVLTLFVDKLTGKAGKTGFRRWFGAVVSMAGVWLVAQVSFSMSGSITGYFYLAGSALCWVVYSFLTRPLFERGRSNIYIVFWQCTAGLAGFLPFALFEKPVWQAVNTVVILHTVFLGIFCSALAYLFYARAIKTLGVSAAAVFINFIPVITVVSGIFVLHEWLAPLQWLGAAVTLAGVCLVMIHVK